MRRHDLKAGIDRPKLICNPHLHVAIDKPRRSFRVEGNEIERSAFASGRVIRTLQTVPEKIAHELSATARSVRTANPRRRQRAPHARNRLIVQFAKFLGRAAPVADVGFVPTLPIPLLDFGASIPFDAVPGPLIDQLTPLRIVLRRIGPTGENFIVLCRGRPMMLIRLRLDREILRHETDLNIRPDAVLKISIEDAIQNCPVVNRISVGIFVIRVGAAPLQSRRAIAGGQQIVRAKVNRARPQLPELSQQLLSILHVSEVWFVRSEHAPDRTHWAFDLRSIDTNLYWEGFTSDRVRLLGKDECINRAATYQQP